MHSNPVYLQSLPKKKVGFSAQVALMFFVVSGGAYGLEALVGEVGPFWSLVFVTLVPVFWALPIALMVAELSSSLPSAGGYYGWVNRALGRHWGFQQGWFALCYSAADMALYPVLFVTYLSFFFPELSGDGQNAFLLRWSACCAFIMVSLVINLRGARVVGWGALFTLFLVVFPFAALIVCGAITGDWSRLENLIFQTHYHTISPANLAAGLAIILWNYCGWDNSSTYANEVENPQRNYPRVIKASMALIVLSYVLPLLVAFMFSTKSGDWSGSSGWPHIAALIGGPWLGTFIAVAALFSAWSLFNTQLLYGSRLPLTMARDGWLPRRLHYRSPKTGAPTRVLIAMALAAVVLSTLSLTKLMVVDILFYSLSLALQFVSLIYLRKLEPNLHRPFRIPLSRFGLILLAASPLFMSGIVILASLLGDHDSLMQLEIVGIGVALGYVVYLIRRPHAIGGLYNSPQNDSLDSTYDFILADQSDETNLLRS